MVCRLWAARYFIELRFKTRCSEHGVALIFLLSGFPKKNQTRINANWPFWATTELLAELLTTKSWSAGCLDAAVLVFLVLTMTLTSSSDNLASSSSAYFFLFTWRFDRLFCKKKRARQGWKKHIYKKKKNIQQTQITSYINSELKIKTMVQDKGCAISRIFPNLSSAINHKKKTSSKPSLWLYPIWSTCLFLHGQSMVMSIICASL